MPQSPTPTPEETGKEAGLPKPGWAVALVSRAKALFGLGGPGASAPPLNATGDATAKARLLDSVLQDTAQGFWFVDAAGITTDLNPAMAEMLGRSRQDVLGRPAIDFVLGEDRERMQRELDTRRNGARGTYGVTLLRPDGSRLACLNTASPLHDADGQVVGSVGIWTDISRQTQAESALRVSEVVINASAAMIAVVDEHHVYRMVNDTWCRATGLSREQVIGRRSVDILPGSVTDERRKALLQCLQSDRRVTVRDRVIFPNGEACHLRTDFFPIADVQGSGRMVALASRDVTVEEVQREALVTAAEVLRCTLDATGDALFATDADPDQPDQPLRFANEQLFQLFQLPDAWRPTPTLRQLTEGIDRHVDGAKDYHRLVKAIIDGQAPPQDEVRLRDGRVLLRRYASVPMGGRRLRVWSMRDITSEKQAIEAREAIAADQCALLAEFPGYIAVVGQDDRYVYVNQKLASLWRQPAEALVDRPLVDVLGPERGQTALQQIRLARLLGRSVSEVRYDTADGTGAIDLEVQRIAGPRHGDGSQRVYIFGTDITERKHQQVELSAALAEAERANRAKSQFLSRMSHELRTPLNAVMGFGQLLQHKQLEPAAAEHVDRILAGGRHLLSLIDDLLDLSRVEAGELALERQVVPAVEALDDVAALVQPLAAERGIRLQRDGGSAALGCWADARRLRQVLLNLVSNAIKYNPPGGRVGLSCRTEGGMLEFRVTDTGPGLSDDEQSRLFRPFERLGAAASGIDGTGIGLALSRHLVESMGGRIGVHSTPGQGCTFWVRLAPATAQAAPTPHLAAGLPAATGALPRALYIEDNPVNQVLMEAMLEGTLALVVEADPLAGLQRARAECPDLILLDIQLPGLDGFEVLRRLRADVITRHIPVVAVSANAMPADLQAGRTAGFDDYLTKPVDMTALLASLQRLLHGERPSATDAGAPAAG